MSQPHPLGAKPHKKDDRDYLWRYVADDAVNGTMFSTPEAGTSPTRALWKMHDATFRIDQGNEGTCVGHGTVNQLAGAPRQHLTFPDFADVNVAHTFARNLYFDITGDSTYQEGAWPRDAMAWCLQKGYAAAYYRLAGPEEVIDYLLLHGIVGFASPWYSSMDGAWGSGYDKMPYMRVDPSSPLRGYHYYVLSGIDLAPEDGRPPRVRAWNSWGPNAGFHGTAAIEIDDLAILYDGDAWVMTENKF